MTEPEIWVAIDTKTNRLIDFGRQGAVTISANEHKKLSGNECKIRKLKIGMKIYED